MKLNGFYTQEGAKLLTRVLSGEVELTITRAAAGSGNTAIDALALSDEKQALPIGDTSLSGGTISIPVTLLAADAVESYNLTEVGLYAQADAENEILYHIYRIDQPVAITADSGVTMRFYLSQTVSESSTISIIVDPQGLVTQGDLDNMFGTPGGIAQLDSDCVVDPINMPYTSGTEDLEAGVTPLKTGHLHFVYE